MSGQSYWQLATGPAASSVTIEDEFITQGGSGLTSNLNGQFNWIKSYSGDDIDLFEQSHPGIIRLTTTVSLNAERSMYQGLCSLLEVRSSAFLFRVSNTSGSSWDHGRYAVGWSTSGTAPIGGRGVYLVADKTRNSSNWVFMSYDGGGAAAYDVINTGVPVTMNKWQWFEFKRNSSTSYTVWINDAEFNYTLTYPPTLAAAYYASFYTQTTSAGQQASIDADYFNMTWKAATKRYG